jgi:hypothetical protein
MSGILAGIVRRAGRSAPPRENVNWSSAAEVSDRAADDAVWERKRADLVAAVRRSEAEVACLRARLHAHWEAKLDASRQGMMAASDAGPAVAAGRHDAQAPE